MVRSTDRPAMTIAVDLGRKATRQTKQKRLFIAALWSPAGKGLTSWLLLVMFIAFCCFPMGYPGSGVLLDCIVS